MAARASSCNSIQLQFVSKLVRLSPQPPTTRPTGTEQRLITGHHFLFIAATWATTTYLSSSQCPAVLVHDGKQADQKPRSLCRHSVSPAALLAARRYLCRRGRSPVCTGFLNQHRAQTCSARGTRARSRWLPDDQQPHPSYFSS